MKKNDALISIVIVNYNGKKIIDKCINSILEQTYKKFEIIIVDNASTDGSVAYIHKKFPQVLIKENKDNLGYAGGCNIGATYAKGEFLLLCNTDMHIENRFLEKCLKAFEEIPNAAVIQSKIVYIDNPQILDTCGGFWTNTTLLYHVGNSKKASLPLYNKPFPVFTVKGVAILIKKSVSDKIGLFDEDFWCYYEETDFCHRAWLAGYECWYYPKAITYHAGGGTSLTFANDFIQFHNFKNKLLSFSKNFEKSLLLSIIPKFVLLNILLSIIWLLQGKWKHSLALYKALLWNVRQIPKTKEKRNIIQQSRKKRDAEYLKTCLRNPRFSYYINLLQLQFEKYND